MAEVIVYYQEKHPQCEELKGALREQGVSYREINIRNPEAVVALREQGCNALEPPVISVRSGNCIQDVLTNDDLFWDGALIREAVLDLAGKTSSSMT
jgi:glutaredoxin